MPDPVVKLNFAAIGKILKTAYNSDIDAIAKRIHANAGEYAEWSHYTTDRGASSVHVPAWAQAADGALTKACARAGVPFKAKR